MPRSILIATAGLLAAGCASSRAVSDVNAPLRAGVLPITAQPVAETASGESDEGGFALHLDQQTLTAGFVEELDRVLFTDAVPLVVDVDLAEETSAERVEEAILRAVAAADVDVVIWPELEYAEAVRTGANEKLWLNLPLFLIGGPLNWFPNDRSYFVEATLEFHVLDVEQLRRREVFDLRERALVRGKGSASEIELDLFDRAGNGFGHYALGIVVPGVMLARQTETASQALAAAVCRTLTEQAVSELQSELEELLRGESVASYFPDLNLEPAGDGFLLSGSVVLTGTQIEGLRALTVRSGDAVLLDHRFGDVDFEAGLVGARARRSYPIEPLRVTADQARAGLRTQIEDTSGRLRTFTYAIR